MTTKNGISGVKTIVHEEFHIKGQGHGPLLYERLVRLAGSQNSRVLKECSTVFYSQYKLDFCKYLRVRYLCELFDLAKDQKKGALMVHN